MAFVSGVITTISSGNDTKFFGLPVSGSGSYTNKLISFVEKGSSGKWTEILPPMPTRRRGRVALRYRNMSDHSWRRNGGKSKFDNYYWILNTKTHQWSAAAHLPEPKNVDSATVIGDNIYIIGGQNKNGKETNTAYTCSLKSLIKSSTDPWYSNTALPQAIVWKRVADCPVMLSTCVSLQGRLLIIGGKALNNTITSAVHMYNPNMHRFLGNYQPNAHCQMPTSGSCCQWQPVTDTGVITYCVESASV